MRRLTERAPFRRGDRYVLSTDDVSFEVDPAAGGRVASFSYRGVEVLADRGLHPTNWGSTLWTSPQSDWGWPPPAEFDDVAYAASIIADGAVFLRGPTCASLGVALTKQFSLDGDAIVVEYGATNVADRSRALALWEVSRVPPRGLTFFPTGAGTAGTLPLQTAGRGTWYAHDPSLLTDAGSKSYGDGLDGFVAHAHGGVLFVKAFADVGPERQAPGEGEVEIYGNNRYVEVEVQGPYVTLAPGETTRWTVRWKAVPIPSNVAVAVGSAALLELAGRSVA